MTLFSMLSVLLATVVMGFFGMGASGRTPAEVEVENTRKRTLPKRWSNLVIAMTVVYFFLLLAGLSYAGWFRVA